MAKKKGNSNTLMVVVAIIMGALTTWGYVLTQEPILIVLAVAIYLVLATFNWFKKTNWPWAQGILLIFWASFFLIMYLLATMSFFGAPTGIQQNWEDFWQDMPME